MTEPRDPRDPRDPRNPNYVPDDSQGAHEADPRVRRDATGADATRGVRPQGAREVGGAKKSSKGLLWALAALAAIIIAALLIWWLIHHFTNDNDDDANPVSGVSSSVSAAVNDDDDVSTTAAGIGIPGAPVPGGVLGSPTASAPPAPTVASTTIDSPAGKDVRITDPAIIAEYASRGYEKGYLGKPLGPVVSLPSGGKFLTLQGGSIYYNPVTKKAYSVHGAIGGYWGDKGHETSPLGYPNGEETPINGGLSQSFDNGTLTDINGTVTQK